MQISGAKWNAQSGSPPPCCWLRRYCKTQLESREIFSVHAPDGSRLSETTWQCSRRVGLWRGPWLSRCASLRVRLFPAPAVSGTMSKPNETPRKYQSGPSSCAATASGEWGGRYLHRARTAPAGGVAFYPNRRRSGKPLPAPVSRPGAWPRSDGADPKTKPVKSPVAGGPRQDTVPFLSCLEEQKLRFQGQEHSAALPVPVRLGGKR